MHSGPTIFSTHRVNRRLIEKVIFALNFQPFYDELKFVTKTIAGNIPNFGRYREYKNFGKLQQDQIKKTF